MSLNYYESNLESAIHLYRMHEREKAIDLLAKFFPEWGISINSKGRRIVAEAFIECELKSRNNPLPSNSPRLFSNI